MTDFVLGQPLVPAGLSLDLGNRREFGIFKSTPPPGAVITGERWGPGKIFDPWTGTHVEIDTHLFFPRYYDQTGQTSSKSEDQAWSDNTFGVPRGVYGVVYPPERYFDYMPGGPTYATVDIKDKWQNWVPQDLKANPPDGHKVLIQGQVFIHPSGFPVMVKRLANVYPIPGSAPPAEACAEGLLSDWSPPGVMQVWPKVGTHILFATADHSDRAQELIRKWRDRSIPVGSTLWVCGPFSIVRSQLAIVPEVWEIRTLASGPPAVEEEIPDEWKMGVFASRKPEPDPTLEISDRDLMETEDALLHETSDQTAATILSLKADAALVNSAGDKIEPADYLSETGPEDEPVSTLGVKQAFGIPLWILAVIGVGFLLMKKL